MQLLEANLAVLKDSTTLLPASTEILAAFKKKKNSLSIGVLSFPSSHQEKKKRKNKGKNMGTVADLFQ